MKAQEFCYWLQGYFELSGASELTTRQTEMIDRHLAMVSIHEKGDGRSVQFCNELREALRPRFGKTPTIDRSICAGVKSRLNEVFLHEIDPSYPLDDQSNLNAAHLDWNTPIDVPASGPWNYPPGARR
jgi:hypothetical protein